MPIIEKHGLNLGWAGTGQRAERSCRAKKAEQRQKAEQRTVVEAGVKAVESGERLTIDYMEKPALYP